MKRKALITANAGGPANDVNAVLARFGFQVAGSHKSRIGFLIVFRGIFKIFLNQIGLSYQRIRNCNGMCLRLTLLHFI